MKTKVTLLAALCFFGISTAIAQEASQNESQADDSVDSIERVQVYGQRPLKFYRQQLRLRETEFYDLFNRLTNDTDMKIECEIRTKFASNMKERVCEPRFVSRIKGELTQRNLQLGGGVASASSILTTGGAAATSGNAELNALLREKREELASKMVALVNSDPDLYEKYISLKKAKEEFDSRKGGN